MDVYRKQKPAPKWKKGSQAVKDIEKYAVNGKYDVMIGDGDACLGEIGPTVFVVPVFEESAGDQL